MTASVPWRFDAPDYVLDLRPGLGRAAGAAAMRVVQPQTSLLADGTSSATVTGSSPVADMDRPHPCVVLLSRVRDPELDAIAKFLDLVGVYWARLNADELDHADLVIDPLRSALRLNGRWLTPTVTWLRHFSPRAIPAGTGRSGDLFRRDSWACAAAQFVTVTSASIGAERPGPLTQLAAARYHGIATPRTLVTSDPALAPALLDARKVVVKATGQHFVEASPGVLSGYFPVVADASELSGCQRLGLPVIVQEYLEHKAELRVYYLDGHVVTFEVGKGAPADPWLAASSVSARRVDPGPAVSAAAERIASALGLRYGAFDFLIRGDGSPVFLEVNPDGDWLWAEHRAGTDAVTLAAAGMLCRLHRRGAHATGAAAHAAGAFDLLAFLVG